MSAAPACIAVVALTRRWNGRMRRRSGVCAWEYEACLSGLTPALTGYWLARTPSRFVRALLHTGCTGRSAAGSLGDGRRRTAGLNSRWYLHVEFQPTPGRRRRRSGCPAPLTPLCGTTGHCPPASGTTTRSSRQTRPFTFFSTWTATSPATPASWSTAQSTQCSSSCRP